MSASATPTLSRSGDDTRDPLLRKIATFGVVGAAATGVHLSIAWALLGPVGALAANAAGFAAGLAVTYLGNYFATFRSQAAHGPTLVRFLVVSAATLAASEWTLVVLHAMRTDERVGLVVAIALLPLLRFGLLARQVFVPSNPQASLTAWLTTTGVWSGSVAVGLLALWVVAPPGFLDPTAAPWSEGTIVSPTDTIPLLTGAVRATQPILDNGLDYFPTWFLVAFSAAGPAAVVLLRQLGIRRPEVLIAGAALAAVGPALAFGTLHPAWAGWFLPLLIVAAALRIGDSEPRWTAPLALGLLLGATALVHPGLIAASLPLLGATVLRRFRGDRVQPAEVTAPR